MPRKKNTDEFNNYVRVNDPDRELLSELTKRAVGSRTVSKFAELCGVSPSTILRIINCAFSTPSSTALIAAIADNAEPGSGITREIMFKAHGVAEVSIAKASVLDSLPLTYVPNIPRKLKSISSFKYADNFRNVIQNALLEKGYGISMVQNQDIISTPTLTFKADFCFTSTSEFHPGFDKWAFDVHISEARPVMHKLSWIFGAAYLESMRDKKMKFSLVLDNAEDFEQVKNRFENVRIYDLISVILVDEKQKRVIDEFFIPTEGTYESILI